MARLEGRLAVVTGGTRGIGLAVAEAIAREGAGVVVCSRKADGVAAAVATLRERVPGAMVEGRPLHVGDIAGIPAFWDALVNDVGTPDLLVNNAGTNPYFGPMLGTDFAAWDKTFDVNIKGPFALTRCFAAGLFSAKRPGAVVNVSSILGHTAAPLQGVYGMTKAAILSMTKTLAVELADAGIRVNALAPGVVDTRLAAAIVNDPHLTKLVMSRTPLKRVAQPEEMAGLVVFLCSNEASYVTGQTFFADGGYTIA